MGTGVAGYWSTSTYNQNFSNFDYRATLIRLGDEDYAANVLYARASGPILSNGFGTGMPSNYYSIQYTRDGRVSVMKRVNGADEIPLLPWTYSSAVKQGDQENELRVYADGSNLTFYMNGSLVWSGADSSLSTGRVGVGMWTQNGGTIVFPPINAIFVRRATLSSW